MTDTTQFKILFESRHPTFRLTDKSFFLDGKRYDKGTLPATLKDFYLEVMFEEENNFIQKHVPDIPKICDEVAQALVSPEVDLSSLDPEQEKAYQRNQELVENHKLVTDVVSGRRALVKKGSRRISPIAPSIYKELFTQNEWREILRSSEQSVFTYDVKPDPDETKEVITDLGPEIFPAYNEYIPPRWTFEENKGDDLHPDHKRMIEARFLNAESLERYYCVLFHVLTHRNKNICGLVHKREGTGKSMIMGRLPRCLVGNENTTYTDKNFMASPHKDALLKSRVVFLDEHRLTSGQSSIEKQFVEDRLYINPKGKAAITIENNISFFMASNEESDIYTEPTNRRHYFLEDSGRHIIEEFGRAWVAEYVERIERDPAFVANLGYWIINEFKNPKYPADAVYRGPTFERVVKATCFPYFSTIVDNFINGEYVDAQLYSDFKHDYNKKEKLNNAGKYFPRLHTFIDFFNHFRWNGRRVCEVRQNGQDAELVPIMED